MDARVSLEAIREDLTREEDTILFQLYARSLHPLNPSVYKPVQPTAHYSAGNACVGSLLDVVLYESEQLNLRLRPYKRILDRPFFESSADEVPLPELPPSASRVNFNSEIRSYYLTTLLPRLAKQGTDSDPGASALCDVQCLQALSRRVHYGLYVAEAKFRNDPELYTDLILREDSDKIMECLTFPEVEETIIDRVRTKAGRYANLPGFGDLAAELYGDWLIPITKELEVLALINRFQQS